MVSDAAPAVAQVLEHAARQMAIDGGGLRYLGDTPDGYVRLQLTGACATCPGRMLTLDLAIERPLRAIGAARGVELAPSAPA
ncbi:MAG: NifU family protein [Chloroflexota bacterium]|nr:NifU family protein [Chloroflexota bacterium]